ncbi:MAG: hypothetical protein ORN98_05630 [Alphaproteobacteria bacterium]|nr:hypothetical protein [Alphaproteobacteria bacterium]
MSFENASFPQPASYDAGGGQAQAAALFFCVRRSGQPERCGE